jgi:hypothetical protein
MPVKMDKKAARDIVPADAPGLAPAGVSAQEVRAVPIRHDRVQSDTGGRAYAN